MEISSAQIPVFSHRFAISFIKVIFVAKKAFDAYLINSAALLEVLMYWAPFDIKGEYNLFKIRLDFLSFEPSTSLYGKLQSITASPSLKPSGLDTT